MDTPSPEEIQTYIAALEAECVRLQAIEAAAKEARAFLEGRRPGFAATYALDVLRGALTQGKKEADPFPIVRNRGPVRQRRRKP